MKKQFKALVTIITTLVKNTGNYFELYAKLPSWTSKLEEIDDDNERIHSLSGQAKFGLGLVLIIVGVIMMIDYASIREYIEAMVANAGGIIGFILSMTGFAVFILFELLARLVIRSGRNDDKAWKVFLGYLFGVILCFVPAFLVWQTYNITPDEDKSMLLYNRTITFMIVSLVLHLMMLVFIDTVLDALQWFWYRLRKWGHGLKNPRKAMNKLRKELIIEFVNFDRNLHRLDNIEQKMAATENMNNRAWYLRQKFADGDVMDDYDLSDYNEGIVYSPFSFAKTSADGINQAEVESKKGNFSYGQNGAYTYTVV